MSANPATTNDLQIREATLADIPEILRQRRAMYEDMDYKEAAALSAMVSVTTSYLAKAIADGSFRSWLASVENRTVAGGAIIISPWPAHPYDLECRRATILNVYTDRDYRRRGIGRHVPGGHAAQTVPAIIGAGLQHHDAVSHAHR